MDRDFQRLLGSNNQYFGAIREILVAIKSTAHLQLIIAGNEIAERSCRVNINYKLKMKDDQEL